MNSRQFDESKTEVELLRKAQAGDEAAFSALLAIHLPKMYNWAHQIGKRLRLKDGDEYDIVQDVMLKAWTNISRFRGDSKFTTWLYAIMSNQASNYSTKNQRDSNTISITDIQSRSEFVTDGNEFDQFVRDEETPEELLIANEVRQKVMEIISGLPSKLREAIVLREVGQLSYLEISERTGTKLGTVKTQIHRARVLIDKELTNWQETKEQ